MKLVLTLILLVATLGGCAIVPLAPYGYRGDGYHRGPGPAPGGYGYRGDPYRGGPPRDRY